MKFPQTFVSYHGCGNCYLDGTNQLVTKNKLFFMPTHDPFWKRPKDSCNRIARSTTSKLKVKPMASRSYRKKYFRFVRSVEAKNYEYLQWSSESSSDDESNSYSSDNDSTTTNTEQKLPDNKLTGENLITVENTIQNSDISNKKETPDNKYQNDTCIHVVVIIHN